MTKIISIILTCIMYLFPCLNIPKTACDKEQWKTEYTCVFVHGLSGWGEYDEQYNIMPYWGMLGGNLMTYLNSRGFDCHAASVDPTGSAWDRACELYAQLTGTRTDYGKEHSERCNHERYGEDYTGKALIDDFSEEEKINLIGHSFGGATVLTFLDLMAKGSEKEIAVTDENEISPFFTGEKLSWIYSVTTLAAPLNGTTAYDIDKSGDYEPTLFSRMYSVIDMFSSEKYDDRIIEDYADYDMDIDNAMKMMNSFETFNSIYYFSVPCSCTVKNSDGTYSAENDTELLFYDTATQMGQYTGVTAGGYVIDESWLENDGLVNTISSRAPFNAPQKDLDVNNITTGIWNVFPTYRGDHMAIQGGLLNNRNVREYYVDLLNMINCL